MKPSKKYTLSRRSPEEIIQNAKRRSSRKVYAISNDKTITFNSTKEAESVYGNSVRSYLRLKKPLRGILFSYNNTLPSEEFYNN